MANLVKKTMNLDEDDWKSLSELHPDIPVSLIIRKLIAGYIKKRRTERAASVPALEVEFTQ